MKERDGMDEEDFRPAGWRELRTSRVKKKIEEVDKRKVDKVDEVNKEQVDERKRCGEIQNKWRKEILTSLKK